MDLFCSWVHTSYIYVAIKHNIKMDSRLSPFCPTTQKIPFVKVLCVNGYISIVFINFLPPSEDCTMIYNINSTLAQTALCFSHFWDIALFYTLLEKRLFSNNSENSVWTCVSPHSISKPWLLCGPLLFLGPHFVCYAHPQFSDV